MSGYIKLRKDITDDPRLLELAEHYEKTAALYDRMGRWQEAKDLRKRIGA